MKIYLPFFLTIILTGCVTTPKNNNTVLTSAELASKNYAKITTCCHKKEKQESFLSKFNIANAIKNPRIARPLTPTITFYVSKNTSYDGYHREILVRPTTSASILVQCSNGVLYSNHSLKTEIKAGKQYEIKCAVTQKTKKGPFGIGPETADKASAFIKEIGDL